MLTLPSWRFLVSCGALDFDYRFFHSIFSSKSRYIYFILFFYYLRVTQAIAFLWIMKSVMKFTVAVDCNFSMQYKICNIFNFTVSFKYTNSLKHRNDFQSRFENCYTLSYGIYLFMDQFWNIWITNFLATKFVLLLY